ncbi:hypothetical protein C8R45DRAFT_1213021 [Mycena sanguinolenta]|nr:hypothetical protein C8R45DRAFT_1213021 [Mycena sanguinolenta]
MSFPEQVPEELWLEIIHRLPKETLPAVALTHRTFHRISRPLLFTHFTFRPYAVAYLPTRDNNWVRWHHAAEPIAFSQHTHDRQLARLNFRSSSEIAPLVRSCTLIPLRSPSTEGVTNAEVNTSTALLAAFFEKLLRFTSIRYFQGFFVRITQTGLENLCRLPALACLDMYVCSAIEPLDSSSLQLQHVTNLCISGAVKSNTSLDPWMRILRPTQLLEIHLAFSRLLLREVVQKIPSLPEVKKLTIRGIRLGENLRPPGISIVLSVLAKFPAVEKFALEGGWDTRDWAPSILHSLPRLQEYSGPVEILAIFRAHAGLTRASLQGVSGTWITETVQELETRLLGVSSLSIASRPLDIAAFNSLFDIFPVVAHLDINISHHLDIFSECPLFLENLADLPALPITLQALSFHWKHHDPNLVIAKVAEERNFHSRLRALVERDDQMGW